MDHNILLIALLAFFGILIAVRIFLRVLPVLFLIIAGFIIYLVFIRKTPLVIKFNRTDDDGAGAVEEREEGMSLKYSKIITGIKKNINSIGESFTGDNALKQIIMDLMPKFKDVFNNIRALCKKATQIEEYVKSIDISKLKIDIEDFKEKKRTEKDGNLAAEFSKNITLLQVTIENYHKCEKILELVDTQASRVDNFFDDVKLKIANLVMTNNISAGSEIDELSSKLLELSKEIEKLEKEFLNIIK